MFDRHDARADSDYTRGALAEFESEAAIIEAVRALRERGYADLDAITPRPVEALQDLMAAADSQGIRFISDEIYHGLD